MSLQSRAVIYLDAHSAARNPLLDELRMIANVPSLRHVILIDDVRMFGTPDWHGLALAEALALIQLIDPCYQVSYLHTNNAQNDLLVAELPA